MKPETNEKISWFLLTIICITVNIVLFVTVISKALGANLSGSLLG